MNLSILKLLIIISSLMGCKNVRHSDGIPKNERIQHRIIFDTANQLEKEKKLNFRGLGGSNIDGIRMMHLSLGYDGPLDIAVARKLIIYSGELLLKNINTDEEIRPYLYQYPFTGENIKIFISVQNDKSNMPTKEPLKSIMLSYGTIRYFIYDENENLKEIHRESYEEALKIVQEEKKKG